MGMRMQRFASFLVVILMWAVLPGCGGSDGGGVVTPPPTPPVPSAVGSVSGRLNVEGVLGSNQARLTAASKETAESSMAEGPAEPDFVPGEIIVRFKPEVSEADAISRLVKSCADVKLENLGSGYPGGSYLFRTDVYKNEQLSRKEAQERTISVLQRLRADPAVRYAQLNAIVHGQAIPNDTAFNAGFQWSLRMIGLPAAWELTTGSSGVVVAVLDSGIRADHPELVQRLLPGYDFVSDPINAGDGDGVDPDPTDPDVPDADFHGTHVAGTIAANSNNQKGVAGVAWNVQLMPIRVLGLGKNNEDDLIQGMRYAAGLPNRYRKTPIQPAQVINMSLGGIFSCMGNKDPQLDHPDLQNAIDEIRKKGIIIVVASGNHAAFDPRTGLTNPVTWPASCEGVIAVGAVTSQKQRAYYSTHHDYVDIAAPGGETIRSPHEGIYSTMKMSKNNVPQYQFLQGTSMAAPHVAGVIALMRSVNANLTPDDIELILKQTAEDLDPAGRDAEFGYGLVRADKAVAAAAGVPVPTVPIPYPEPSIVVIDSATGTEDISVSSLGSTPLQLSNIRAFRPTGGNVNWLSASLVDSKVIRIEVNGSGLTADSYFGLILADTNGGGLLVVPVIMRLPFQGLPDLGQVTVSLVGQDPVTGNIVEFTTTTDRTQGFVYRFPSVRPGNYIVFARSDKDGNGVAGDGPDEAVGAFPFLGGQEKIIVEAGKENKNINFPITKGITIVTTNS